MKKKVLIIDDSALMRRILSDIIMLDDRFLVYGTATNGQEGVDILKENSKDIDAVLLDINMPVMNGIELLKELNKNEIDANVIIVSSSAKRDAAETILSLELGAFDFVTKPERYSDVKSKDFSRWLLDTLAVATQAQKISRNNKEVKAKVKSKETKKRKRSRRAVDNSAEKIVAIACSTGGPQALHTIIPELPQDLDASVIIVQHMPIGFTKTLSNRINEVSKVYVKEAEHGELLEKGTVYIAKGGHQMRIMDGEQGNYHIVLTDEPPRNSLRPCADIMYESLMDTRANNITCVVLTGMGGDGTNGINQLNKTKDIHVIAQDKKSSVVYGMPGSLKKAGLVDEEVSLDGVANAIIKSMGVQ